MTSLAGPDSEQLAVFTVPSEPGNERLALARVADAVEGHGLSGTRLERLKTAVAEAAMNAIEHGNHNRAEIPVGIEVAKAGEDIVVTITDEGGEQAPQAPAEEPDLLEKLQGGQSPRGWGLFLIRNMVDAMEVTSEGRHHIIRLSMRTGDVAAPTERQRHGGTGRNPQ
ncbi:MAG TPA: ATP-binding protein [Streptosporangiaceae bacterium]|nr:ATP-binding protein [Streptosporangiaceae bacterium]